MGIATEYRSTCRKDARVQASAMLIIIIIIVIIIIEFL